MRTVSEVAALAGVTVRTLHHYDKIGLLTPSGRSHSGYRLYDHTDLARLQQILLWRELGFGLSEIAELLDDPGYDHLEALRDQRASLAQRVDALGIVLKSVDAMIGELEGGPVADEEEMFMGFDHDQYAEETKERWGDSDAYRQSQQRLAGKTKADYAQMAADGVVFAKRLAETFTRGVAADSAEAMDLAEEARRQIDRDFYDCSKEMHVSLGDLYVADPRFTEYYDRHAEGLAAWWRDAIVANAAR